MTDITYKTNPKAPKNADMLAMEKALFFRALAPAGLIRFSDISISGRTKNAIEVI